MESWGDPVREDHEALEVQAGALDAIFKVGATQQDRWVALKWITRSLKPILEVHLRKEEDILFPALEKLLGVKANAIPLLLEQHQRLRAYMRHLAEMLDDRPLPWGEIAQTSHRFVELLEDHERKEEHLLLEVLESNLQRTELLELAKSFRHAASESLPHSEPLPHGRPYTE